MALEPEMQRNKEAKTRSRLKSEAVLPGNCEEEEEEEVHQREEAIAICRGRCGDDGVCVYN